MIANGRYLLDSDVLVVSTRIHYHPGFCAAFWDWVDFGFNSGHFYSVDKVKDELVAGDEEDALYQWCKRPALKNFFLPTKGTTSKWGDIANWAQQRKPEYLDGAKAKFLNVKSADAWLIAYAATNPGFTIVTNERGEPNSRRDIKLPDAAAAQGVRTMPLSQLLRTHAHNNFTFKP